MKKLSSQDLLLTNAKHIHMIGIGGSGMCPIAEILHSKGHILSGSDNNPSDPLSRVIKMGAKVTMGHKAENVKGADLIIYSAAIHEDNPEIQEAKRLGIPLMERSAALGAITRHYNEVIGVCGTHGKTTTSSIITQILYMASFDPTAVIGGRLPIINANGRAGESEYMVCESCEFVDTFLSLSPDIAVLLNIDNDHLDYFKTMDNLVASFTKFVTMAKVLITNGDDTRTKKIGDEYKGEVITFGLADGNDFSAKNITAGKEGMEFDLYKKGEFLTEISLSVPGEHNVYNALAAAAAADYVGVGAEDIARGISAFGGAGRRFEKLGIHKGIMIADDYAHHPTEIKATLTAAKNMGYNNVIAVFQPFTFSRTELLKNEFIEALSIADKVILTPIMGSREVNVTGISSNDIGKELKCCYLVDGLESAAEKIAEVARSGDLVITMGGGDIYKSARKAIEILDK